MNLGSLYEIGYEIDILDGKVDVVPLNMILNKMGFLTIGGILLI